MDFHSGMRTQKGYGTRYGTAKGYSATQIDLSKGYGIMSLISSLIRPSVRFLGKAAINASKNVIKSDMGRDLMKSGLESAKDLAVTSVKDAISGKNIKQIIKKKVRSIKNKMLTNDVRSDLAQKRRLMARPPSQSITVARPGANSAISQAYQRKKKRKQKQFPYPTQQVKPKRNRSRKKDIFA